MRLIFAYFLPLGVDEAYQITIGREFDWSYYDHPPLSFWLPRIVANILGLESILIYRLPSIIFGSITIYALYGIGLQICGKATALWSALLYCISPFFFFSRFSNSLRFDLSDPGSDCSVNVLYSDKISFLFL